MGVDCETTPAGVVLFLASGEDSGATAIYDGAGLGFERIAEWLLSLPKGPLYCGFFFDYDANQIIRLLPAPHQTQLAGKQKVTWKQWRVRHIPGRRFTISDGARSITVWDVSGWAQCSFATLCDTWNLGSEADRAVIRAMKARRGTFETATEAELSEYTTLECSLLSEWVRRILELHSNCGLKLRAYTGAGATASAIYRRHGWTPPAAPQNITAIAEQAYYGGRSEISRMGPAGAVWIYDINSAYPHALSEMPEVRGARWIRACRWNPAAWGFWYTEWELPEETVWGPFPMRGAPMEGGRRSLSLLYPTRGSGWYHSYEVEAAIECYGPAIQVTGGVCIEPRGRPFAWVHDLARERLEYKAARDARQFPLKVGLNSLYGKMAQQTGSAPLRCPIYAAAITARTRAALLRIAARLGHDACLLATDGVITTRPVEGLNIGPDLGQWEVQTAESAWFLQAGVYWAGGKQRARGIDARALNLESVDRLWRARKTRAVLTLPARRVVSYRQAVARGKPHLTGTWEETTRRVVFTPEPRRRAGAWLWGGTLLTFPARTTDYMAQNGMDAAMMDMPMADDYEAMPEWAR